MNFLSNIADSIPVVGHVKGICHYAVGDTEGGNKAMYQATRTSAVLGGGAAGCLAGPGGAVLGAMYAGLATDAVASVAMDESQGIVKGCKNIAEDLKDGKNPTGSILSTGFQVGMDGIGGLGMGGVSSAASQVSEKAVAKTVENVAKKTVETIGEKAIQKTVKVSGEEMVKLVTKNVSEKVVKKAIQTAAVQAEVALVSAHVAVQAKERTKKEEEERAREEMEQYRRERRAREERERREREERERREREERDRQDRDRRAREERERRETAQREREERERREREERNRQDRDRRAREERERSETAQREQEERERRAREERDRQDREDRERRAREERERNSRKESGRSTGSGPPSQPPQGDKNNNPDETEDVDYFAELKDLLKTLLSRLSKSIRNKINNIFSKLHEKQIEYISEIIERLMKSQILNEVVQIVVTMLSEHFSQDISFENFISLLEFVATYFTEEVSYRTVLFRMSETISRRSDRSIPRMEPEVLERTIRSELMNLENLVQRIVELFRTLSADIESETAGLRAISPNFRNIFSAVYHYFKHRQVPGDGTLSVREYFDWIRLLLRELGTRAEYTRRLQLQQTTNVRGNVVCDMYVSLFGRRVRVVVKFQGRTTVLSSCFVVEIIYRGDKEGTIIVNYYNFNL